MNPPLEQMPDDIKAAYHEFKGSTEYTDTPTAQSVLEYLSTARTTGYRRDDNTIVDAVTAHFASDAPAELPTVITDIAARHDLVEADREYRHDTDSLRSVVFIRDADAHTN